MLLPAYRSVVFLSFILVSNNLAIWVTSYNCLDLWVVNILLIHNTNCKPLQINIGKGSNLMIWKMYYPRGDLSKLPI